ncbi:hypothetical protein B0J11DRAFT_542641 [Dendryphion nanum]|uniref:NADPH-dependent 1-acyldihydroxyacetone phosphate reductase n=1 Tax=Dendryphion nanum TaxID=256645 RepID=A0A9P9D3K7_9PLEO|nr:hypothetical protein B0J11DRAFT_542641 [Dendryphion nanum]
MSSSTQKTVLITGCSNGSAGHALALEFASRNMRVFATARSLKSLSGLQEKGIEVLTLDVTSAESIAALKVEISSRTGGKLDMLFNNAGSMYEIPAIEADPTRVRAMFDANVFGVFDMTSAFAPLLLAAVKDKSNPPTIINTASVLARVPYPFSAAYNASKAAVASYTDTLRLELAPLGIKVVTLFMGVVSTNIATFDSVQFGPDSLYVDAEAGVKNRSREHQVSGMKPDQFARGVVNALIGQNSRPSRNEYIWKGAQASTIWLLNAIGWRKIFDPTIEKEIGFNQEVKRLVAQRGRDAVQRKSQA